MRSHLWRWIYAARLIAPAFALLLIIPIPASAGAPDTPPRAQSVQRSDDLRRPDDRYAFPRDGLIVQAVLPPRPSRPKHAGGSAALLEDGEPAKALPGLRSAMRLVEQHVATGNPHADAWCSRAPPRKM